MTTLTPAQQQSLLRQLEYYFSDESFSFDDFLQSEADASGAVPVATLSAFPRIAGMLPDQTDEQRQAELLAAAALSDSVVVSGEGHIKRLFALPQDDTAAERSLFLSGFRKGVPEAEVRAAIAAHASAETFGPILSVRRLRDLRRDRSFSGLAFLEFEKEDGAAAAAAAAEAGEVRLPSGKPLKGMLLSRHYAQQTEVVETRRRQRDESKLPEGKVLKVSGLGAGTGRDELTTLLEPHAEVAYVDVRRGGTDGFVRFRTAQAAAIALAALTAEAEAGGGTVPPPPSWSLLEAGALEAYWATVQRNKEGRDKKGKQAEEGAKEYAGPVGVMLRFEVGAAKEAGVSRESLSAQCAVHGDVAYLDYTPGAEGGYVRFRDPAAAKTALAALSLQALKAAAEGGGAAEGGAAVGGASSWRLLGAEEEVQYREAVQTRKRQRDEERESGPRGVVLHVAGLAGPSATDREALSALCAAHGEVAFVDYTRGAAEGYVRFKAEAAATAALNALAPGGGAAVGGAAAGGAVWRRLDEAEEDAYKLAVRNKRQRTDVKGGKGKGGKGKGGKGKGKGKGGGGGGASFGGRGRGRG